MQTFVVRGFQRESLITVPSLTDPHLATLPGYGKCRSDPLIGDRARLRSFADDYADRTGQKVELTQLSRHLFNLRKRGEARGGLPKLRRTYNGRT